MKKEVKIKLVCTDFPGIQFGPYSPVYVGLQKQKEVLDSVPGNTQIKAFLLTIEYKQDAEGKPNFLGPYVFGKTGDKFLYLVWLVKIGDQEERFRRAKIKLNHLSWPQVEQAQQSGTALTAHISMTDKKGGPACASLKEDLIRWEEQ